jgi:IclR family pca regulon transcriptional regulator
MTMDDKDTAAAGSSMDEDSGAAPARRDANQMGGFAKGLAVIEAFGRGRPVMSISDTARVCGLDRATARRCLLTLVNAGYATSDGRLFELTPRILRLGHAYLSASLPRLIGPSLEQLAGTLRESCSAAVLDGSDIVYVARVAQHRLMGVGLHAGSRLPAYCTAMGRVLLAALPVQQSRALIAAVPRQAYTDRTLTDVDAIMAELETVRANGYALIDGELESGSSAVAVPLLNISGATVAAINVGVQAARVSNEQLRNEVVPQLLRTQTYLSEILP